MFHSFLVQALRSEGHAHTRGLEADALETLASARGPALENPPSTQKRKKKRDKKRYV